MEVFFLDLVNLSITASWLILAVLLMRLVFRKAPRRIFCILWGLVGLRLLCPFSLESALSLIPSAQPLPHEILYAASPEIHSGIGTVDRLVNPILSGALSPAPGDSVNPAQVWSFVLSRLWAVGAALILLYGIIRYLLLKRRVATATLLRDNIKQSERVDSPFVLGIFRPTIYLPYSLAEADRDHVIAHERAHIRRKDHWWKLLGFVLLAVYWFHPLIWVANGLLCRDMELACDERVIRGLEKEERRAYAEALLRCAARRQGIAACPLAFGEIGVKHRIKNVMEYQKPAKWVTLLAITAAAAAVLCLMTVPKNEYYTVVPPVSPEDVLIDPAPDTSEILPEEDSDSEKTSSQHPVQTVGGTGSRHSSGHHVDAHH
ncbi:MAG: hypothetical protein J1E06_04440 [Acutalibacter sp.]|nr:hypothetical protein [Acutalibacter sp.]